MASETTLGDALKAAVAEVGAAIDRRNELVRYAVSRGASYRGLAAHLGISQSTVHRWGTDGEPRRAEIDPLALPAPTSGGPTDA